MRKLLAVAAAGLLLLAAAFAVWRYQHPDPRTALARELKDPGSVWAQALRPETAVADLAHFRQAPVYRIDLDYAPGSRLLKGKEEILYTNQTDRPISTLYLATMARAWGVAEKPEDKFSLSDLKVDGVPSDHTMGELYATVPLRRPLRPGKSVVLTFSFQAQIPWVGVKPGPLDFRNNPGTYGASNLAHGLSDALVLVRDDVSALDNLTEAGTADTPSKALYDVCVTAPSNWRVISGGVAVAEKAVEGGRQTTRIAAPGFRFYLFVSSSLRAETRDVDGVRVTSYYSAVYPETGKAIAQEAAEALQAHQAALGTYPFGELEVLPLNFAFGGMNPGGGLVLINGKYSTGDTGGSHASITDPWLRKVLSTSITDQRRQTVFHEIAHSWWGDLVWPDMEISPWWLEGITHATALASVEKVYGTGAWEEMRERSVFTYRYYRATGTADIPIGKPVPDPNNVRSYLLMSYDKPALFYDRLRHEVGDEALYRAMRQYLARHRFGVVRDRGPVEELLSDPKVEQLYQRWLLESHGDEDLGLFTPEQVTQLGQKR